jgi:hypothetical protein
MAGLSGTILQTANDNSSADQLRRVTVKCV